MTRRCLIESKLAAIALTTQYTALPRVANNAKTANRVDIDHFLIGPPATGSDTIKVYLVPSGGTAGPSNLVLTKTLASTDGTYTCPEIVGQVLEPGDFIATSSTAGLMPIRAAGDEQAAPT